MTHLIFRRAAQDDVVHQDQYTPFLGPGGLLLLQQFFYYFRLPLGEEEARVPVHLHELGEHRAARRGAYERDHEVKPRGHSADQVRLGDALPLAPAADEAEVERDFGGEPVGVPRR